MELYIKQLSNCQQRENQIREQRDLLIREHEKKIKEINNEIVKIFTERNEILAKFNHYLNNNQQQQQQQQQTSKQVAFQRPRQLKLMSKSAVATSVPVPRVLKQASEDENRLKTNRSRILRQMKSTKSLPTMVIASPTTTQIESILYKVRDNEHSLDGQTMSQCIDLLSSKITKDRNVIVNLQTPTPTSVPDRIELIQPITSDIKHSKGM